MTDEMKLLMALCDALGFEVSCKCYHKGSEVNDSYVIEFDPSEYPHGPIVEREYFVQRKSDG